MENEKREIVVSVDENLYERYRVYLDGEKPEDALVRFIQDVAEGQSAEQGKDLSILQWLKEIEPMQKALKFAKKEKTELYGELSGIKEPVKYSKELEMVVRDVVEPLLLVIFLYKVSDCYNKLHDDEGNCGECHPCLEARFRTIIASLSANIFLNQEQYVAMRRIVDEVQHFVYSYESADGLPNRWYEANKNLRYYTSPYALYEESPEAFEYAVQMEALRFVPEDIERDMKERAGYFEKRKAYCKENNLEYDEDDWLMEELAYALRIIVSNDLHMCSNC